MIDNKLITIVKENQFDKGWTLFHPYDLAISNNRSYKEALITDVVRQITHSTEVNLILCEPCLSSRIVNEIEWANKYIKLNVIIKNESVLKKYPSFNVSSKCIDNTIDFNYIGIHGKDPGFYMINEGYVRIDDSVDKIYFQNYPCKRDYSFLETVNSIIIVDKEGNKDHSELVKEAKNAGVKSFYVVNTVFFDRSHFDYAKAESLTLLVSSYTVNGVILVHKDRTLSCLVSGTKDFFLTYPIEKVSAMVGREFVCGFYADTVDTKKLCGDVYTCYNGVFSKLNISEKKIVPINVPIKEMADFVNESFDHSVAEYHNAYSAEAIKVEYKFTLIPPLFDKSYVESEIYKPLHTLCEQWKALQKLNIAKIKTAYYSFIEEDFGLINFFDNAVSFTDKLSGSVKKCSYKGYYIWLDATVTLYKYYNEGILDVCKQIFNAINQESSGTKFTKFDDEIAGYEQTIKEKKALIEKGVDVLSNKRRVEILEKKIADLTALKQRFENTSDSRNDKSLSVFITHCNDLLSNNQKHGVDDSIGTIVKPKEETKSAKLYAFVDTYLYAIKKYLENCLVVLNKLQAVHIPEDYPVFDKNGKRFIVIDSLQEYEKTKPLCQEFSLKCLARR